MDLELHTHLTIGGPVDGCGACALVEVDVAAGRRVASLQPA